MFFVQFSIKKALSSIKPHKSIKEFKLQQEFAKRLCLRVHFKMSKKYNLLKPPEQVAGLKSMNKTLFDKQIMLPVFKIKTLELAKVLPVIKKYLLKVEKLKPIQKSIAETETNIYLNPEQIVKWDDFTLEDRTNLEKLLITSQHLQQDSYNLTYDNFSSEAILKAILPKDKDGVASFTKVGHILHLNLREHLLPFKQIIGQVLLDKNQNCRCVVNKTNNIDNTYRNFEMEILAGSCENFITEIKENRCRFQFDFAKVYWNSRLCTEHERIIDQLDANGALFDVFAGVGPFAVPSAKKGCLVYANDLNPESFKWLNHNAKLNKVKSDLFTSFHLDGGDFIKGHFKSFVQKCQERKIYVTMNLPAIAVEFLPHFFGLFDSDELGDEEVAIVYVYCFAKGENCEEIARSLIGETIGACLMSKIVEVYKVRTVSNFKEMMRVKIRLDRDILCGLRPAGSKRKNDETNENCTKRICKNGEEEGEKSK